MKNGLFYENDELIFYENGEPTHAGVVKVDGDIYYISSKGRAVKGQHIVHGEMANDILKRGTYTFGDDYKLVKGSYIPPKKQGKHKPQKRRSFQNFHVRAKDLAAVGMLALCLVLCLLLGNQWDQNIDWFAPKEPTQTPDQESSIILFPPEDAVLLCSASAKQAYDHQIPLSTAILAGDPYSPFQFKYELEGAPATLLISEHPDLSDASEYLLEESSTQVAIDNLKTGTTYYYKVIAGETEISGYFQTAPSTRFVTIPKLSNTRDIGGYVNLDGKTVKQGLLVRGSELDGLVNSQYFIPIEDMEAVHKTFGFVYDFDLRSSSVFSGTYHSRLCPDASHKFYDAPSYGQIFSAGSMPALREIFSDLANPDLYPMYLHCTWGTDRTGTIVFLLQGILNMSQADMIQEYHMSGYYHSDILTSTSMDVVIQGLESYEGATLQEKIETFLTTAVGVTQEEIDSIQSIFLED